MNCIWWKQLRCKFGKYIQHTKPYSCGNKYRWRCRWHLQTQMKILSDWSDRSLFCTDESQVQIQIQTWAIGQLRPSPLRGSSVELYLVVVEAIMLKFRSKIRCFLSCLQTQAFWHAYFEIKHRIRLNTISCGRTNCRGTQVSNGIQSLDPNKAFHRCSTLSGWFSSAQKLELLIFIGLTKGQ